MDRQVMVRGPQSMMVDVGGGFATDPPQTQTQDPEVERLRAHHPLYDQYAPEWLFYVDAYEGGNAITTEKYLFRHTRENELDFDFRVKRAHYQNICGPLVDFFTNFIYTEPIRRTGGSQEQWFQDFIKDVDKRGASVTAYMKDVSDKVQIYGIVYNFVDSALPPEGVEIETKQQEADYGVRPYWVAVPPTEITDWIIDEVSGAYTYIKRVQMVRTLPDGAQGVFEKYTEFYPSTIRVSYIDASDYNQYKVLTHLTKEIPNQLGIVPVVVSLFKRGQKHPEMGLSFLRDPAPNNREIMNLTSLLQEFLYRQCFNILAVETVNGIPLQDQNEGDIGTSNQMEYPKGGKPPVYITPPADPAQFIQSERDRIVTAMYRQAAQDTLNELFNGEKSSGFSQAQSFSRTVPFIATRADVLESTEMALFKLTMLYLGSDKTFDGTVKYKDRYELTSITDAMTQLLMIFRDLYLPSPTFVKTELKRVVREFDDKLDAKTIETIEAEIDAIDFTDWQATQKEALVGKGVSPSEQQRKKDSGTLAEIIKESNGPNVAATKKLKGK